jgi:hypothetical protein
MLRGNQERPIQGAAAGIDPKKAAWYVDTIALDSPYNYEPVWQRCVELGIAVTQHSGSGRWMDRASVNNFTYNHVGHFAESNHAFARGVFLGGRRAVTNLNFGFAKAALAGPVGVSRLDRTLGKTPARRPAVPERNQRRRDATADRPLWRSAFEGECRCDHE